MNAHLNQRIDALDVLRGLALALMLLVNNPGSWAAVYAPFLHASWHGLTPTDLVFPFFLFVVGASMACSLRGQIRRAGLPWLSVCKRAFLLFLIGLILQIIPFDQSPDSWRIMGVLQRIGLCFLIVAVLITMIKERFLLLAGITILLVYWLMLERFSDNPYSLADNLVRHGDIMLLGAQHLYQGMGIAFDPEGLFSTLPASITVLSGYLVCSKIQRMQSHSQQILYLLCIGTIALGIALLWAFVHPINKSLWTGSFVLVTSALACFSLALIILCWNVLNMRVGFTALKVYGSNPIFIYVAAWLFAVFLTRTTVTIANQSISLQQFVYSHLQLFMADKLASLTYAFLFACLFYAVALVLYKKRIFIKL